MNMAAKELIAIALENLQKTTGIVGKWEKNAVKELDGKINFRIANQNVKFTVLIKNELRNYQLPVIIKDARRIGDLLIVANHLFPKIKETLRENNIGYLETNGNIWMQKEKIFIWNEQQKTTKEPQPIGNRAFTKTGLKVLLHFLLNEEDINLPYREIAAITEVALGHVNYVMTGLQELGYLVKLNKKEFKLTNKKELLEKWMTAYGERLQPTLKVGSFRFLKEEEFLDWKKLKLHKNKSWWGAEPAGDILTNYLKPETLTLYTVESRAELIKNYRLVPDEKGNVHVFYKCWNESAIGEKTAPPLLVYADLMNKGGKRSIETAQKIYNEYLQDRL